MKRHLKSLCASAVSLYSGDSAPYGIAVAMKQYSIKMVSESYKLSKQMRRPQLGSHHGWQHTETKLPAGRHPGCHHVSERVGAHGLSPCARLQRSCREENQGEGKNSIGNGEAKDLIRMTHGPELRRGECRGWGVQGRGGKRGEKNWDNCNSIINKI